jgi:Cu/Ag efflux protein CusF
VFRLPRWAVPGLFVVLLAAFGAGIWGTYREAFPAKGLHRVTGVFEIRAGESLMLVRHEAVPGLMPEMRSMVFVVESKELLDQAALHPGDRVRLTVRQKPDHLLVVEIRKLR